MDKPLLTQNNSLLKCNIISASQVVNFLQQSTVTVDNPLLVAQQILAWTNGQPELTYCLVKKVLSRLSQSFSGTAAELVNQQVKAYFSPELLNLHKNQRTIPVVALLHTLKESLLQDKQQKYRRLQYYQQVLLSSRRVSAGYQTEHAALVEAGLISENSQSQIKVSNPIYRRVFNAAWVEQCLDSNFSNSKAQWLLLTSLLSILAFVVLQSTFRYIPVSRTNRCLQEADLRDAVLAKVSLEPIQMQRSIERLLKLQGQKQLSTQCQSVLYDLQYSYGIYVSAGTYSNPLDAAQYLCQIPELYYKKRNSVPWFSRWSNLYERDDFAAALTDYVEQNPCPSYGFLNRVNP
ncbi:MAG: hypothetical protein AAF821_20450 [Cyanobacteria bacterium P01_D01_bin.156]